MKGRWAVGLGLLAGLVTLSTAGCAAELGQPPVARAAVAQASVARVDKPQLPEGDLAALSSGNSAFAIDLYGALRRQEGNLFFSPYSISLALAMTYAGARGETEAEMAKVLHYNLPQDRLHPAFNALDQQLAIRGSGAAGQDGKGFRLKLANSVWGQSGYRFLPQYLETLARNYGAGLRLVDFAKSPEPARLTINDWVKKQTEGKVVDLLPQGVIDPQTRLVLANAIYFNAAWKYPFSKEATRDRAFTLLDGSRVDVPMMSETKSLPYARGDGYQAVELPYDGGEMSLVVMLPDPGAFEGFERPLSNDRVQAILKGLQPRQVALTLPKFSYESSFNLADTLSGMGMPEAMGDRADFSGMDGSRNLFISDVIHKAIVVVDERGTEAAAATAVGIAASALPAQPVTLTIDRPFVFLIRDIKTGTLLFMGRVVNPGV